VNEVMVLVFHSKIAHVFCSNVTNAIASCKQHSFLLLNINLCRDITWSVQKDKLFCSILNFIFFRRFCSVNEVMILVLLSKIAHVFCSKVTIAIASCKQHSSLPPTKI